MSEYDQGVGETDSRYIRRLRRRLDDLQTPVRDAHGNFLGQRAACGEEGSADSAKAQGPQVDSPAAAHHPQFNYLHWSAYHAGHHDTVEGQYTDVLPADLFDYWQDRVQECLDSGDMGARWAHQPQGASPRTDIFHAVTRKNLHEFNVGESFDLLADFARELERELADAQANIEIEQRNRDAFKDAFVDWKSRATSAQAELAAVVEQQREHQIEAAREYAKQAEELAALKHDIERAVQTNAELTTELEALRAPLPEVESQVKSREATIRECAAICPQRCTHNGHCAEKILKLLKERT